MNELPKLVIRCRPHMPALDWQPIETAPQDGITKIVAGAWSDDRSRSTIMVAVLEPFNSTQGDVGKPRYISGLGMIFYPTHWIPLPVAPAPV